MSLEPWALTSVSVLCYYRTACLPVAGVPSEQEKLIRSFNLGIASPSLVPLFGGEGKDEAAGSGESCTQSQLTNCQETGNGPGVRLD